MRTWVEERPIDPIRRTSKLRKITNLLCVIIFLWFGGFLHYANNLPLDETHLTEITDAVVVLTGGAERLKTGIKLLEQGKASKLLISGVDKGTTLGHLKARSKPAPILFNCCVDLGYNARDTQGNAIEAAVWARQRNQNSIRLVTANYHMPRAMLLFRQAMPKIKLLAHPVIPINVKLHNWWLYPGTTRLLATEFSKYLMSLIKVRLTA